MKEKIVSAFFFFHSVVALAMDVGDPSYPTHPRRAALLAQEQIFIGHIPEEIQLYVLSQLPLAEFCAITQTCKRLYALAHDRRLCLEQEPAALIQQLQEFIAPDGTVNLQALLPMAIRTRDADVLLYEAGINYLSKPYLSSSSADAHFEFNEQDKPALLALYLAENMGHREVVRVRSRLYQNSKAFLDVQEHKVWQYFFPVAPQNEPKQNFSDLHLIYLVPDRPCHEKHMPSYLMCCDFIDFGHTWNLSLEGRFMGFIEKINRENPSKFYHTIHKISVLFDFGRHRFWNSKSQKIRHFFYARYMQIYERQIHYLLALWKKRTQQIDVLRHRDSSSAEKMAILQKEKNLLREELNLGITKSYDSYRYLRHATTGKISYLFKKTFFYRELGDKLNEGIAYNAIGYSLDNKTEGLFFTLKAISLFQECGEKLSEAMAYSQAAKLSDNQREREEFSLKAVLLYLEVSENTMSQKDKKKRIFFEENDSKKGGNDS